MDCCVNRQLYRLKTEKGKTMGKYYKADDVYEAYYESGFDDITRCDAEEYYADLPTIEVSEDCISRKWLEENAKEFGDYYENTVWAVPLSILEDAPSVAPSRAEGEWYRQTTDHFDYWECSECGMGVGLDDIKNYCPNCGAKMKG